MGYDVSYFSIVALESLLSFFLNFLIVVFHVRSLRNGLKLNPASLIQLAMGMSNISMRGTMLGCCVAIGFPMRYVIRFYQAMIIIVPFHLNFSYWLIAWLCTYYCTTITNIKHRVLLWMKRSLKTFLPHLFLLSAVVSFVLSIQSVWYLHIKLRDENATIGYILPVFTFSIYNFNLLLVTLVCTCLPFLIALASLTVTMSSLFRHIWKVKMNGSEFTPPNLQAHVSAVRTMLLLFVLSVLINVTEIAKLMAMSFFGDSVQLIIWIIVAIFPSVEASILIQSSRKLKKVFLQTFCGGRCMEGQSP